jgi:deoxyribose-phosphate aldolase
MSTKIMLPLSKADVDKLKSADLARFIDHTQLKADATGADIDRLCDEAREHRFCAVCVNSGRVVQAVERLKGSAVKVCAVVGFPLGAMSSAGKAFDAGNAVEQGAREIDMVMNIGALKSKDYIAVEQDIRSVRAALSAETTLKVIIETCMLSEEEKAKACEISKAAGANFVKTSTGFSTGGAKIEDIGLMRKVVGNELGVKASGGIRSAADAKAMLIAGATRIGCGAGVAIVTEQLAGVTGY